MTETGRLLEYSHSPVPSVFLCPLMSGGKSARSKLTAYDLDTNLWEQKVKVDIVQLGKPVQSVLKLVGGCK